MGKQWKHWQILFSWVLKSLQIITAAMKLKATCSLEEKLLGLINKLDTILKSRDITLPSNVHIVKVMFFPVDMCSYDSWTIKKAAVQSLSPVLLFATPWTTARQASLFFISSRVCSDSCPWVDDATQPSHLLSPSSPPVFNLSQHQGPFQWVRCLHQVPKVLELQLQHQSFQWIFRTDFL